MNRRMDTRRSFVLLSAVLLGLGACAPGAATAPGPSDSCPASLEDSVTRPAGGCRTPSKSCAYRSPAGTCTCEPMAVPQCGGVETPRETVLAWRCTLAEPDAITRDDDCPLLAPAHGHACNGARRCAYTGQGRCLRDAVTATCAAGRWQVQVQPGLTPP